MQKMQHTLQCITSSKCTEWKSSILKHKTYLEQQVPTISAQLDKSFSKYLFSKDSKAEITRFEKTSFELTVTEMFVKIEF